MIKGGDDIEADVFLLVKNSAIATFIKGTVYREGKRPLNATTEDAVVTFKTGLDGQFQDGEIVLNIYVPNIKGSSGLFEKDITRCRLIGNKMMESINTFTSSEYHIRLLNIPQSFKEQSIEQYYVNARIRFKRNTIN